MDFSISTLELQKIIKLLSVVVKVNATDFTGRICIESVDGGLNFLVNNGSTTLLYTSNEAVVKKPGETSISCGKIKSFITSFKPWDGKYGAKNFYFKVKNNNVNVTVDDLQENGNVVKAKLKLACYNSNLVQRPIEYDTPSFVLNSTAFRLATSKVLYAINPATSFGLYAIQGMNVNFDKDNIWFAGTDGKVLSEYALKNSTGYKGEDIILQYDFLMGLRRIIANDQQLLWEINKGHVNVKIDNVVFGGKLVVGHKYPDYKPTFDQFKHYITLNKATILNSLTPFADILDPEDNYRITVDIKDKIMTLHNDQARIEFELADIQGGLDLSIDVNGKLLIQTVDAIYDDNIILKFSDGAGVLIFDSSTTQDQKALLLPLRRRS